MSKKPTKTFIINLEKWVFFDPEFNKDYGSFIPISRSLLSSNLLNLITDLEFRLLIGLIEVAHRFKKGDLEVSERSLRRNGKVTERSLTNLQQNRILRWSYKEEEEEVRRSDNNKQIFVDLKKDSEELFAKKFQDFVLEKMQSSDTGYVLNYFKKVREAFLSWDGFEEFAEQVTNAKTFSTLEHKERISYFKKALSDELSRRGVK